MAADVVAGAVYGLAVLEGAAGFGSVVHFWR